MLPGSTALSEITSRIRQKGVLVELKRHRGLFLCILPPERGKVRNHTVFFILSICVLGVSLFGAETGALTPFWRSLFT